MFRDAFPRNRCIIPASGYYEWQDTPSGKQPRTSDEDATLIDPIVMDEKAQREAMLALMEDPNNVAEIADLPGQTK